MKYIQYVIFLIVALVFVVEGYFLQRNKPASVTENVDTSAVSVIATTTAVTPTTVDTIATTTPDVAVTPVVKPVVKKPVVVTPVVTYSKIGQKLLINGVWVTPLHVTYDGRCPVDVKCIQAGTVDLGILLQSENLSQNFILSLGKSIVFAGKTITFSSVSPKKVSTKTIGEAEYRFVITVKK
jgi:hypothetical protein